MELNENTIKLSHKLMKMLTKGYQWYHDTPEQPFELSQGSIWLINPETKQWIFELEKSGKLWYYFETPDTFSNYLNMRRYDFESFIKIWVEDALKRGVVSTGWIPSCSGRGVEDALKRGVVSTGTYRYDCPYGVEDVLKKGVVSTAERHDEWPAVVEDALKRGVVSTCGNRCGMERTVEDALKNGKQWN
jgi:hypothetical protein